MRGDHPGRIGHHCPTGRRPAVARSPANDVPDMTKITDELLESGRSESGGWSRAQLHLIGVAWPPPKGWKRTAIGREVPDEVAAEFVSLRGGGRAPAKPGQD